MKDLLVAGLGELKTYDNTVLKAKADARAAARAAQPRRSLLARIVRGTPV